ncbi:MAG: hypothetical protein BHV99_06830 [Clostridium sp. 26_21]|nr:MAG: hypothetical protein BHV99_06830 [Clostridium sp. 26_21]
MKISKTKKYLIAFIVLVATIIFMPKYEYAGNYSAEQLSSKFNEIRNKSGYRSGEYYLWNDGGWFSDYCTSGHGGYQCHGYGINLFDWLFNQCAMCSSRVYNMDQICVGDLIRYNNAPYGEHTVIVQDVVGDTVYFTDANGIGDGTVRWDNCFSKSYFQERLIYIAHASGNDVKSLSKDTTAPTLSDIHVHSQSIGSDSIRVRVYASDNVGVTKVKFSAWQTGNSATSGTTKWATSMGNGYWETTFTKAEAKIVGDNLGCIRAWAYDATGNESNYDGIYDFVFGQKVNLGNSFVARIVSKSYSNYCIGLSGTNNGDDLKLKTKNQSDDSQLWSFIRNSDGTYQIINVKANKSFDTDGGTSAKDNGTIMQLWSYTGSASQMQYVIQSYNGGYRFVPANQDKVRGVDLKDGKAQENQPIIVYQVGSKDNKAQTWTLEKVATSISMNVSSTSVKKGETKQLSVKFNPTDVATKSVKWTTSNSAIATVSSSGVVTGIKEGNVTITATTTDGSNKKATCNVTIIMPFKDVDTSHWGYNAIKYVYDRKYMSGTNSTTFLPEAKITRGMVVTILHNMEGQPYVSGKCKFSDVQNTNEWYYSAIKWASANNIVSGYSNGKFGPNDLVTREQLAVILNQYCKYKGKYKSVKADYSKFADSNKISSFAKWGMNWAVGTGIINGSNKKLNPQGNATRAEMAAMIYNYCTKIK